LRTYFLSRKKKKLISLNKYGNVSWELDYYNPTAKPAYEKMIAVAKKFREEIEILDRSVHNYFI